MGQVGAARRVAGIGPPVLECQGELGSAGFQVERLSQRDIVVVLDLDHAEQSIVRLPRGDSVRMRVIPVQRPAIAHLEVVGVGLAGRNRMKSVAVVPRVDGESVPMCDRWRVEAVGKRYAHAFPAFGT